MRNKPEPNWISLGEWRFNWAIIERKFFKDIHSECWLWLGAHGPQGPLQSARKNNHIQMTQAVRLIYMKYNNRAIAQSELRHTCGNKKCVNPAHRIELPIRKRS
jgi:hypothetical protein